MARLGQSHVEEGLRNQSDEHRKNSRGSRVGRVVVPRGSSGRERHRFSGPACGRGWVELKVRCLQAKRLRNNHGAYESLRGTVRRGQGGVLRIAKHIFL